MIDTWIKQDIDCIIDTHPVAVFVDESGDAEFLLKCAASYCTIHEANSDLEELHVKYLIEREKSSDKKHLIYTKRPKEQLSFIREYCEVYGCLEIKYLQNYIKDKVHQTLNLNINLPKDEIIAAAKVSVGKDRTYWMDLSHKGGSEIFDLSKELLPFIHNPDGYAQDKFDDQLREAFYRKVNELLGQDYMDKPAETLASEVVNRTFNGIISGDCPPVLLDVYKSWLDSVSYKSSFQSYIEAFKMPNDIDIWAISPDHPFVTIDEKWFQAVGGKVSEKSNLPNIIAQLKQRDQSPQAKALGINFWADIITLLEFDPKDISYLSSFSECVDFYKKHFCMLDTAIRNLYTDFLHTTDALEPYQELYKEHVSVFLEQWFKYFDEYKENQTGILQRIIDDMNGKTAVIVGDGVAYEIAEQVALKVKGKPKLTRASILADVPSETENNMSHIYMANGVVEAVQNKREKYLSTQNSDLTIDYTRLDEVNDEARSGQLLVCTYKDIDDIGDKLNNKALKYFPEAIDFFAEKISQLLASGYAKVFLITDHGFVLTGMLSEADKIIAKPTGESHVSERFIWTTDKQAGLPNLIEVEKSYKDFKYLYFSQNMNPFKTPGLYGFAHGGIAPQELVTPYFCWESSGDKSNTLAVTIGNKTNLKSVTGELFQICIEAEQSENDLFAHDRKVYLAFFASKSQINKSDIFTINSGSSIEKEYTFDGHDEIEVQLLDAVSKQQLDRVLIKQNKDRDLGGLL